ncbi:MAG TPA: sulfotransferase [candidate division Zixibacteria bacterium]|nr:sulfotransferase [candidate division Zixibacteria bacterium]
MDGPTYVLLASNAYSGSTLLSFLLGAHPRIATVSDVSGARRQHRMDAFRCSCGRLMAEDPFWLEVRDRMRAAGWPDFDLANFRLGFDYADSAAFNRLRVGTLRWGWLESARDTAFRAWPGDQARMRTIGLRTAAFARVVAGMSAASVFVDASKERLRATNLARHLPLELRVIHLVRDVRAVAASARRHPSSASDTVADAARRWARTNEAISRSLRALPASRRTLVRYEDLCRNPAEELARLYRFCGVDPEAAPPLERAPTQHLLGNRVRLERLVDIRLDERWRNELTRAEQEEARHVAAATQATLYPDDHHSSNE